MVLSSAQVARAALLFVANVCTLALIKLGSANLAMLMWAVTLPVGDIAVFLANSGGEALPGAGLGVGAAVGLVCIGAGMVPFAKRAH